MFKNRFDYFLLIICILFMKKKRSLYATEVFSLNPKFSGCNARSTVLCLLYWANSCEVLSNVQAEKNVLRKILTLPILTCFFGTLYLTVPVFEDLSPIPELAKMSHGSGSEPAELAYLRTTEKLLGHGSSSPWAKVGRECSLILFGVYLSCDSNRKCKVNY